MRTDAPSFSLLPAMERQLAITGMVCGACVRSVESALQRIGPAILSSTVSMGGAEIRFDPALLTEAQLVEGACLLSEKEFPSRSGPLTPSFLAAIEDCGFDVTLQRAGEARGV